MISVLSLVAEVSKVAEAEVTQVVFYGCRCIPGSKHNSGSNASSSSGVIPSSTVSLVVEIVMVAVIGVGRYHRCSWQ